MDRQVLSLWQGARPHQVWWWLEGKMTSLQMSFLSSFFHHTICDLPTSSQAWCHMVWNILSVSCSHLSWLCTHPNLWCTCSLLTSMTIQKAEKAMALCKPCSAITYLYYQLSAQHKSKSQPYSNWKEKKTQLYLSQDQHNWSISCFMEETSGSPVIIGAVRE